MTKQEKAVEEALVDGGHSWRENADPQGPKWFCFYCQVSTNTKLSDYCSGKFLDLVAEVRRLRALLESEKVARERAEAELAEYRLTPEEEAETNRLMSLTPEQIDEQLRSIGLDPAKVAERGRTFVDMLVKKHDAEARAEKAESQVAALTEELAKSKQEAAACCAPGGPGHTIADLEARVSALTEELTLVSEQRDLLAKKADAQDGLLGEARRELVAAAEDLDKYYPGWKEMPDVPIVPKILRLRAALKNYEAAK